MIDICTGPRVQARWLGLCPYMDALQIMEKCWFEVKHQAPEKVVLLACEHPLVITLGKRGSSEDVLVPGIPVIATDRGGLATLHAPGQLVVYPILNLSYWRWGVQEFVDQLLRVTEETLSEFGVFAQKTEAGSGLETSGGKIAFVGLRVQGGVTRHGLSLNVGNQLADFQRIVPCGKVDAKLDRIWNHGSTPSPEQVFSSWQGQWDLILKTKSFPGSVGAVGSAFP